MSIINRLFKRYSQWRKRCETWKKYGNHTRYHFEGPQFDIGEFSHGVPTVHAYDDETRLIIGKYCSLGAGISIILGGNHHTRWTSTYGFYQEQQHFPSWSKIGENYIKKGDVVIGNDVWIGRNATILSGANIGNGAVIGAGAVVAGSPPPYSIVVGNPGKVIGYRFSEAQIDSLQRIAWWNWPTQLIDKKLHLICSNDIDAFIDDCKREGLIP